MAKTLASVKPVKVYGLLCGEHLDTEGLDSSTPTYNIPCTLLTTARYKKLMAVVRAAVADHEAEEAVDANPKSADAWKEYERRIAELNAAIEAAEKAGAL